MKKLTLYKMRDSLNLTTWANHYGQSIKEKHYHGAFKVYSEHEYMCKPKGVSHYWIGIHHPKYIKSIHEVG
jgi:hypothetical protein